MLLNFEETHLCQVLGIKSAACAVQENGGKQSLVAFVTHEKPALFSERALKQHLGDALPSYMVPSRIVMLDQLPKLTSGKVARKKLPILELIQVDESESKVEPTNDEERVLSSKMAVALGQTDPICVQRDFFELGGDSLAAALLISDLRGVEGYEALTVRDVYLHRTASALAQMVHQLNRQPQVCEKLSPPSNPYSSVWSTLGQLTVLLLAAFSSLVVLYGLSFGVLPYCIDTFPILGILIVVWLSRPLLGWLWLPLSVLMTRLVKQVLIGTYKPGRFSVWSGFYVRHWIVRSISLSLSFRNVSAASVFMPNTEIAKNIHANTALGPRVKFIRAIEGFGKVPHNVAQINVGPLSSLRLPADAVFTK